MRERSLFPLSIPQSKNWAAAVCAAARGCDLRLHGGLVGCLNDLDELLGHQGSAADQTAVDVGLGQQLEGVLVVHGAAVQDGDGTGVLGGVQLADHAADHLADLFRLLGSGGQAGADSPDGLVGDDDLADLVLGHTLQTQLDLHGDPLGGDTVLALLQALAAAHDGDQTSFQSGQDLGIDVGVGLAHGAALGVADDDVLAAGVGEHVGGDFTGVGAGGVGVAVLGADAHPGLPHGADGGGDADGGDAQSHVAPAALGHDSLQLGHKLLGFGGSLVHLPVTGDDGFTVFSVHFLFSFYQNIGTGEVRCKFTKLCANGIGHRRGCPGGLAALPMDIR